MSVGILTLSIQLPNCHSLKEKRGQIKPIIHRLHKEFNISVVESDHQDLWQSCELLIACAGSQGAPVEAALTKVVAFYESHWPDLPITDEKIEIII
ncbi:MAG: DUF503 domain-containing protein [Anaerolineales bacterium]